MTVYETHPADSRVTNMGETCQTVTSRWGTGGGNVPLVQPISYRKSRRAQSTEDFETWVEDEVTNTINLFDQGDVRATQAIVQPISTHYHCIGRGPDAGPQGKEYPTEVAQPIAFQLNGDRDNPGVSVSEDRAFCLPANPMSDRGQAVATSMAVRRLTPVECERLQGFPDNYTNIREKCPDGPRYKALGNSMAVPVMRWIGERIRRVDEL